MLRTLLLFAILGVIYFSFDYYRQSHPEDIERFLRQVDGFGFTEVGLREMQRAEMINRLEIPYEKKQVLIQRNVFMGASSYMVQLALGKPQSVRQDKHKNVFLIYYIENDNRPTIFVFQQDALVKAYKGSTSEIGNR